MARNANILTTGLSGKVGDLIFYERNGKPYCRRRPQYRPDRLSAASKQSGKEFGKASSAARSIRAALNGLWQPVKEETTIFRLNKAVYAALREDALHPRGKRILRPEALHLHLKDFRYNQHAGMVISNITTTRREDGSILLQLPANWQYLLKVSRGTAYIQIQAAALDMDFDTNTCVKSSTAATCIIRGNNESTLLLPSLQVKATATIIIIQLRFIHTGRQVQVHASPCNEQAFVAAVLPPALPTEKQTQTPAKTPRIATQKRSAATILQKAANPAPQPGQQPTALRFPIPHKRSPLPVWQHKKCPVLVNLE